MSLLVIVTGNGGSGGSTVAAYIAETLLPGSVHIDKDRDIADHYTPLRDSPEYAVVRNPIYDEVGERMHACLDSGISVVLSSAFRTQITSSPWIRENLEFVCAMYKAELRIVKLTLSEEELKRRLRHEDCPETWKCLRIGMRV